jgi:hypothetical protein
MKRDYEIALFRVALVAYAAAILAGYAGLLYWIWHAIMGGTP